MPGVVRDVCRFAPPPPPNAPQAAGAASRLNGQGEVIDSAG